MKTRQEVPKKLALWILAIMFICMTAISFQSKAQELKPRRNESGKKYIQRIQKVHSWENHQKTWKKNELSAAREYRKTKREKAKGKEEQKKQRFLSKINRIKNE